VSTLPPELDERVRRLEEAALFAEHSGDQVRAALQDLSDRLATCLARIERIERSISEANRPLPPGENADPPLDDASER
jgi:primosomal protein N''